MARKISGSVDAHVNYVMEDGVVKELWFDGGWAGDSLISEDDESGDSVRLTRDELHALSDVIHPTHSHIEVG